MLILARQKSYIALLIFIFSLTSSAVSQNEINFGLAQHNYFLVSNFSKPLLETQDRLKQENNIRESVFRYQFKHIGAGWVKVYFLSFGGSLSFEENEGPDNEFMKRFKSNKPPVKKASQAVLNEGIKDKKTGQEGLILRVTSIKWINDDEVEVDGGYYEDFMSSSGNTYTVKREKGKWVVKKDVMNWIS